MRFVNNYFTRSKHSLEDFAKFSKPFFQTPEGRDIIVKSIAYSEFPLILSEFVFEIRDGQFFYLIGDSNERIEFFRSVLRNEITDETKRQYREFINSASLEDLSETGIVFHTHPRYFVEEYVSEDAPFFSKEDKKFSMKRPLGLVEYCVVDSNKESIQLLSKLSICYKKKATGLLELGITLNKGGGYDSNDGEFKHSGAVPTVSILSQNIFEHFIQIDLEDNLRNYVMRFATRKV